MRPGAGFALSIQIFWLSIGTIILYGLPRNLFWKYFRMLC